MKKFLFALLFLVIFSLTLIKFVLPQFSKAQVPTSINVANYVAPSPDNSAVAINSAGEKFSTHCTGGDCTLCKNDDCSGFEKRFILDDGSIGIQGENWWEGPDTTFRYEHADGSLASWLPSTMTVGETYHSGDIIVQGYRIEGDTYIPYDADWGGPTGGTTMLLESVGPITFKFPDGSEALSLPDVAVFRVIAGPGVGEAFYFAQGIGQIGWGPNIPVEILNLPPEQMKEIIEGLIREIEMELLVKRSIGTCSTSQQAMKPTPLRPKPCEACNDPFGPQTESCATPFKVSTSGEWCLTPPECDGDYSETYNWGGDIVIDFTETKVPFAGYGDSVKAEIDTEISPSASKYLADYFAGTLFYGDEEIDISDPAKYSQEIFRKAGVFRKLAPQELQDIYKREMISRAKRSQEGRESSPVSNYEVENPNYPECPSKTLIEFITGLGKKPLRKNYRTYNEYLTALKEWKSPNNNNGCWPKLWPAVPMFSLEDAPGEIFVAAHPPGQISPSEYRATFPHLARLYESSDKLHQLLTPIITEKMAEKAEAPEKIEVQTCETKSGGAGLITAIGCIPVETRDIASWVLKYASSIGGGLAFLLMGYAVFLIITSAGDPEKIALGQKILTAAIIGLLVIIFSTFLLQLIAAKILKIPGFSDSSLENSRIELTYKNPQIALAKETNNPILLANTETNSCQSCRVPENLLAQANGKQITTESYIYIGENGQLEYGVIVRSNGNTDGHVNTELEIDGQKVAGTMNFIPQNGVLHYGTPGSQAPSDVRFFPQLSPGEHTISFNVKCDDCGVTDAAGNDLNLFPQTCTTSISATGELISNCAGIPAPPPPPEPSDVCQSPDSKKSCSYPDAIMDANLNDPICVSNSENGKLRATLTVNNYKALISAGEVEALQREYEKCLADPTRDDCDPCSTVKLSRWISIKTKIPWLEKIWDRTTNLPEDLTDLSRSGLFHIFTPADMQSFEPTEAKSPIARYSFENIWGGSGGGASPQNGWLYYPYLGGVQQAKKCISEQFLLPRELQLNQNLCPPILTGESIYDLTREEKLERDECTEIDYDISYRDENVRIGEGTKQSIADKVKQSWPESLIEEEWNHVYDEAVDHGWNPAFVIALWIEETGASHFVQTGASGDAFGCDPTTHKSLEESLNCLFSRPYADEDFKEFMLTYSEGYDHEDEQFCLNPNFPGNLKSWYDQLTD